MEVQSSESDSNPWALYLYSMKSPVTRDKYQNRLAKFFEFLSFEGDTIEQKSRVFVETSRRGSNWTFSKFRLSVNFIS